MLNIRSFGRLALGLVSCVLALAISMSSATAQSSAYVGHWWGALNWDGTEYDGDNNTWDFQSNGTFTDSTGEHGTWTTTADGIRLQYVGGGTSVYVGSLMPSGNVLLGTMTNGEIGGQFVFMRGNRPYAGSAPVTASSAVLGGWTGTHRWTNGAVVNDTWDFYSDGTFTAGTPASANGTWRQSGDTVTMNYLSGAQPVFIGTLRNGVLSGTGSTSSGNTATWEMRRR